MIFGSDFTISSSDDSSVSSEDEDDVSVSSDSLSTFNVSRGRIGDSLFKGIEVCSELSF